MFSFKPKNEKPQIQKGGDPLYAKNTEYMAHRDGSKHIQNKDMVPHDVLEEQNLDNWADKDPEKTFVKIEDVANPNDTYADFENEDITQSWAEKEKTQEEEIEMEPIAPLGEGLVSNQKTEGIVATAIKDAGKEIIEPHTKPEKISVNRDFNNNEKNYYTNKKIVSLEKQGKDYNTDAKNSKTNRPFKPWQNRDDFQQSA